MIANPAQATPARQPRRPVGWADLCLLWVLAVSLAAMGLLGAGVYGAWRAWALGTGLAAAVALAARLRPVAPARRTGLGMGALLLATLVLRLPPLACLVGGQDEGLYVNMARTFEREGGSRLVDGVRAAFPAEQTAAYDRWNIYTRADRQQPLGGGVMQWPGIYMGGPGRSTLVFQFYHLHPLWMAQAAACLGWDRRGWSVLGFALLAVLFARRLGRDLSGSEAGGWLFALLLALNPLLVFLGRQPMSETPALAFLLAGYACLARALDTRRAPWAGWAIAAAAAFACHGFTRVTGFLHVPPALALGAAAMLERAGRRRRLAVAGLLLAAYALSACYGWYASRPYFLSIHGMSLRVLEHEWRVIAAGAAVVLLPAAVLLRRRGAARLWRVAPAVCAAGCLAALGVAAWQAWRLAFTDAFADSRWVHGVWGADGHGWRSLGYTAVWAWLAQATPAAALLVPGGAVWLARRGDRRHAVLLLMLTVGIGYALVGRHFVPFQYFGIRHLAPEALPASLLVVSLVLAAAWRRGGAARAAAGAVLAGMLGWYAWIGRGQWLQPRDDGTRDSVAALAALVRPGELLVAEPGDYVPFNVAELITPLRYDRGLAVMLWGDAPAALPATLTNRHRGVVLLTPRPEAPPGWSRRGSACFRHGRLEQAPRTPRRVEWRSRRVWLYARTPAAAVPGGEGERP